MKIFFCRYNSILAVLSAAFTIFIQLMILVKLPLEAFWGPDPGVKFLQAINFSWSSRSINYPGLVLDPSMRFMPFDRVFFIVHEGALYGIYSVFFAAISGIAFRLMGFVGLYTFTLVSLWGTMLCTTWLVKKVAPMWQPLVPPLAGLASPLLFYGLTFWEHAPGVLMATASLYLIYTATFGQGQKIRFLTAGAIVGLGFVMRPEVLVWVLALASAIFMAGPQSWLRRLHFVAWFYFGFLIIAAIFQLYEWFEFGYFIKSHIIQNYDSMLTNKSVWQRLHEQASFARVMLLPMHYTQIWLGIWLAGGVLYFWRSTAHGQKRFHIILLLALLNLSMTIILSFLNFQQYKGADNLLLALPICNLLLVLGVLPRQPERWISLKPKVRFLSLVTIIFISLASTTAINAGFSQWGPRYLMPAVPVIITIVITYLTHTNWHLVGKPLAYLTGGLFSLVILLSIFVQSLGVQQIRAQQSMQHGMIASVEALPEQVVLLDWELTAMVLAPIFEEKLIFSVSNADDFEAFLEMISANQIDEFAFVSLAVTPYAEGFFPRYEPSQLAPDKLQMVNTTYKTFSRDVIERTVYVHYIVNRYRVEVAVSKSN